MKVSRSIISIVNDFTANARGCSFVGRTYICRTIPCALQNSAMSYMATSITSSQISVRTQPAYAQQYLVFYPYDQQLNSGDGKNFQPLSKLRFFP